MWTPCTQYSKSATVKLVKEQDLPWYKRFVNYLFIKLDKSPKYPTRDSSFYKVVTTSIGGDNE